MRLSRISGCNSQQITYMCCYVQIRTSHVYLNFSEIGTFRHNIGTPDFHIVYIFSDLFSIFYYMQIFNFSKHKNPTKYFEK